MVAGYKARSCIRDWRTTELKESKRSASEGSTSARFVYIFEKEMDQEIIQHMKDSSLGYMLVGWHMGKWQGTR